LQDVAGCVAGKKAGETNSPPAATMGEITPGVLLAVYEKRTQAFRRLKDLSQGICRKLESSYEILVSDNEEEMDLHISRLGDKSNDRTSTTPAATATATTGEASRSISEPAHERATSSGGDDSRPSPASADEDQHEQSPSSSIAYLDVNARHHGGIASVQQRIPITTSSCGRSEANLHETADKTTSCPARFPMSSFDMPSRRGVARGDREEEAC